MSAPLASRSTNQPRRRHRCRPCRSPTKARQSATATGIGRPLSVTAGMPPAAMIRVGWMAWFSIGGHASRAISRSIALSSTRTGAPQGPFVGSSGGQMARRIGGGADRRRRRGRACVDTRSFGGRASSAVLTATRWQDRVVSSPIPVERAILAPRCAVQIPRAATAAPFRRRPALLLVAGNGEGGRRRRTRTVARPPGARWEDWRPVHSRREDAAGNRRRERATMSTAQGEGSLRVVRGRSVVPAVRRHHPDRDEKVPEDRDAYGPACRDNAGRPHVDRVARTGCPARGRTADGRTDSGSRPRCNRARGGVAG